MSRFLSLPAEIRYQILDHILGQKSVSGESFVDKAILTPECYTIARETALLRTCKQLYEEGLPVLRDSTTCLFVPTTRDGVNGLSKDSPGFKQALEDSGTQCVYRSHKLDQQALDLIKELKNLRCLRMCSSCFHSMPKHLIGAAYWVWWAYPEELNFEMKVGGIVWRWVGNFVAIGCSVTSDVDDYGFIKSDLFISGSV